MNKFKTAFALLAVLVILAAPAYAAPAATADNTAIPCETLAAKRAVPGVAPELTAKISEILYAEWQT